MREGGDRTNRGQGLEANWGKRWRKQRFRARAREGREIVLCEIREPCTRHVEGGGGNGGS